MVADVAGDLGDCVPQVSLIDGVDAVDRHFVGTGYDSESGRIELAKPAVPGSTMYVTYYRDEPAAPGENNIKVYIHPPVI